MSSPVMMETVRDVPAPNDTEQHIPTDASHSGFPFDDHDFDEGDRSTHFRSQLDDLAQRHPELAEHLNFGSTFPFRSHTLGRHRRGSNENPSGSHDAEFKRYTDRPFGPRLAHFGFPFSRHFDDEPEFYQPAPAPPPPPQQPQQQSQQTQTEVKEPPSSPQPQPIHTEKPPPFPAQESSGRKQNIQQSNTVDLGQKQDPVDENRGQRSMSAPPENRPSGQRFVSSIKIPIQRPGGADMGVRASQPQSESQSTQTQQPPQSHRPNERVIPIHVEGRDEPVIPKNANTSFAQPPPPPQQQRQQSPPPEKIFGRNPTQFTQFLNKGEPPGPTPEDIYKQQQQQYQQQQQKNYQQYQQQQQEEEPQEQPQSQLESSSTIPTQIAQIQNIQKDVSELMNQVEKFEGKPRDKQYLYLDEMLTRNLIKLDNIETEGKENIRQTRKEAIKCIEGCIGILEAKANANAARDQQNETKMEVEEQPTAERPPEETQQPQPSEEMPNKEQPDAEATQQPSDSNILEVSGVSRSGTVVSVPDQTPMEVTHAVVDKVEEAQKPEETKTEVAVEGVATTAETTADNLEVSDASQVKTEAVQEEKKKEKKKGKKKEKAENK